MLNLYLESNECSPEIQDPLQEENCNIEKEKTILGENPKPSPLTKS